jgi:hypothetical protein
MRVVAAPVRAAGVAVMGMVVMGIVVMDASFRSGLGVGSGGVEVLRGPAG